MRRVLAVVAVFLCAGAVFAAPPVSAERPLTSPLYGPAAFDQIQPHAASDGRDILVVWSDFRSRPAGPPDLYGTRVDVNGNPIEPVNRKLAEGLTAEAIVWGNGEYVVAGRDIAGGIWVVRVAANGLVLAPPRLIAGSSGGRVFLAWSGIGYALQWADREETGQYRVALLDIDTRLDRTLALRAKPSFVAYTFTAYGANYVFFYEDRVRAEGCPADGCALLRRFVISQDGATRQDVIFENLPPTLSRSWAATTGGESILLTWQHDFGGARLVEYALLGDRDPPFFNGSVYFAPLPAGSDAIRDLLTAGWDGSEFLITFHAAAGPLGPDHLAARRVLANGRLADLQPAIIAAAAHSAGVTSNSSRAGIFWADRLQGAYDVHGRTGRTFAEALQGRPTVLMGRSAAVQSAIRLAANGPAVLAVWREFDVRPMIVASLVGSDSRIIVSPQFDDQTSPVVAPLGTGFLVAWREEQSSFYRVLARRVSGNGTLLDSSPIVLATETRRSTTPLRDTIDVASDGNTALVVWSGGDNQIRGARVTTDGTVLDPTSLNLSNSTAFAVRQAPRAIWTGASFVVVWAEDPNPPGPQPPPTRTAIRAIRVAPSGSVDATSRVIATGGYAARRFSLAQSGNRITVAWVAPIDPNLISRCLYIQQMDPALNLLGGSDTPRFCGTDETAPSEIELAREGEGFLLVGRRAGNIVGYRLTATAAIAEEFDIAASGTEESAPALVSVGAVTIVGYSRVSDAPEHGGVARVFTRLMGTPSPGRIRAVRR